MPDRIQCEVRVGTGRNSRVIGTENRHLFGPNEGWWYRGLFIFAIAILLYILAWPWAYETATGQSWRFRQQATSTAVVYPQPVMIPPVMVHQAPPSPLPPRELTPEELDQRHSEYLRSHGR